MEDEYVDDLDQVGLVIELFPATSIPVDQTLPVNLVHTNRVMIDVRYKARQQNGSHPSI